MQRKLMFLVKSGKFKTMKKKNIIKLIIIMVYFTFGWTVWAQEGSQIKDFYSPYFLGGTSSVANLMSPQSDAVNPASAALTQRVTLDLSYMGIFGQEGSISGYKGHGINIGNTIPTKVGVFSWSGHYLNSPFPSVDSNSTFSINGSFAKDLYLDFLVGAGLKFAGSFEPGVAASLDIGVISLTGDLGLLKDFKWAVVLQDLGYAGITSGYPDPFTLTGGISANLIKTKDFRINVSTDIGFPGLKSILVTLGSNISFRDTFLLNLGTRLDLNALQNGNSYGLVPSVGINYSFKTNIKEESSFLGIYDRGWNRSEINIQSGIAPITEDLWAAGIGVNIPLGLVDKIAPVIELDISGFETDESSEDEDNLENDDEESAVPVSKIPSKDSAGKEKAVRTISAVSSIPFKVSAKNVNIVTTVENGQKKYRGRYDKRYTDSGISYYMSPNNDGIRDDLTFPINISDSRYLKGFAFIIKDAEGQVVREIRNKEKRIENQGFSGFFDRLFAVKSGIEIPDEFRWDGLNEEGSVVSDGLYYFSVEAWDDNGNTGSSDSFAIVIDSTSPTLELTEPGDEEKIFSPNDDGNKDIISIFQNGSDEDLWSAAIVDASGISVKNFNWIDEMPSDIVWDGRDDNGIMVADGVYSYRIESLDRAGNSFVSGFSNIVKNTEETPITVTIDKSYFSPNNDMILDSLVFTFGIPVTKGIVRWDLKIHDENGNNRRTFSGGETISGELIFDGRDQDGIRLEEGVYSSRIDVLYRNGNNPNADSPVFNVDVTPPFANVKSSNSIFSPNGDGLKDEITFYQESTTEISWTGVIKSESGEIINEYQWLAAADPTIAWNGTVPNGRLAKDGDYTYQLIAIDRAGNAGQSNIIEFTLNTEATPVILTTDLEYFSPNGDSVQDNISIIPEIQVKEGIDSYSLDILDSQSTVIRNFSGRNSIPDRFLWNGVGLNGRVAADGIYSTYLTVIYKKGNSPTASSRKFVIDTVYPEVSAEVNYLLFSPDSDGMKDNLEIIQTSSFEDIWQAEILSERGVVVKSYLWKNKVENLKWDATDDEGNIVPDGKYDYSIYSVDAAGNRSSSEVNGIVIDTEPTAIFLTVSSEYLSPTGNKLFDDITFSTIINNKRGLESWALKIIHESGNIQKIFQGNKGIPKNITWNGVNESGKMIEGNYTALFSALYLKGNVPEVWSSEFLLDISPPIGSVQLSPVPFSPDNDGLDDEVSININVDDASGIKKWTLQIYDPENRPFITYNGDGNPTEKIIWNGKSSTGELVYAAMDYPLRLTLEDELGNISSFKERIPVDVLVVREGDILKIKIANIIFKRNSHELLADSPEVIEQNKYILNRVSELLKKYSSYKITVEGHAVVTRWNDPAAAKVEEETELKPLSEQRALTVLNYLSRLGVSSSRMDYKGMGGKNPIVPHSDIENRWKNRRVEFILWKE